MGNRNLYFGMFRVNDPHMVVECSEGTKKVLDIRPNPIASDRPNVTLNGERLTGKVARALWERDKDDVWFSTHHIG